MRFNALGDTQRRVASPGATVARKTRTFRAAKEDSILPPTTTPSKAAKQDIALQVNGGYMDS